MAPLDKKELLDAAFMLYAECPDEVTRKDAVSLLKERTPGFTDRQYRTAWNRVRTLYDNACRLVFRWANENKPGTTFDLPDTDRIFLDDLCELSRGFDDDQYEIALEYGFRTAIF